MRTAVKVYQFSGNPPINPPIVSLNITPNEGTYEIGDPILNSIDLTATVTAGTNPVTNVEFRLNGNLIHTVPVPGAGVFNYTYNIPLTTANTYVFTAIASDGSLQGSANRTIIVGQSAYYGTDPIDHTAMQAVINGNTFLPPDPRLGFTKIYPTSIALNNNYNCSGGQYIYYLYPASFGNATQVFNNAFAFSNYNTYDVTFTNTFGVSAPYKLFAHNVIQFGTGININIVS